MGPNERCIIVIGFIIIIKILNSMSMKNKTLCINLEKRGYISR